MEVKIARMPEGSDPADLVKKDKNLWRDVIRDSLPAIEYFLDQIILEEKDARKQAKLIGKKILPMVALLKSRMEQAYFVSLLARKTLTKEEAIWEDVKRVDVTKLDNPVASTEDSEPSFSREEVKLNRKDLVESRLKEIESWKNELGEDTSLLDKINKEEEELLKHLRVEEAKEELEELYQALSTSEKEANLKEEVRISERIQEVFKKLRGLEEN